MDAATLKVTGEVERIVLVISGEMNLMEIQRALELRHEGYFRESYLIPALQAKYMEITIPDPISLSWMRRIMHF